MSIDRFNGQIPHHLDTNLLERCQEQLRDYDLNYAGWTEPKNHTISYLAAAYLELAKKYEETVNNPLLKQLEDLAAQSAFNALAPHFAAEQFEESVFEAQMETHSKDE